LQYEYSPCTIFLHALTITDESFIEVKEIVFLQDECMEIMSNIVRVQ